MLVLFLGMFLCLALAVWVVALVAIPARREGRELFVRPESSTAGADTSGDAGADTGAGQHLPEGDAQAREKASAGHAST